MHSIEQEEIKWVKTPLSAFGSKCIMNKHDSCNNDSCKCLCHSNISKQMLLEKEISLR